MKNAIVIQKMSLIVLGFAATCIIPIIAPSIFAYVEGSNNKFKNDGELSMTKVLISMLLGVLVFAVIFGLTALPLPVTVIICSLNSIFVNIFFFLGFFKREKKNKKIMEGWKKGYTV